MCSPRRRGRRLFLHLLSKASLFLFSRFHFHTWESSISSLPREVQSVYHLKRRLPVDSVQRSYRVKDLRLTVRDISPSRALSVRTSSAFDSVIACALETAHDPAVSIARLATRERELDLYTFRARIDRDAERSLHGVELGVTHFFSRGGECRLRRARVERVRPQKAVSHQQPQPEFASAAGRVEPSDRPPESVLFFSNTYPWIYIRDCVSRDEYRAASQYPHKTHQNASNFREEHEHDAGVVWRRVLPLAPPLMLGAAACVCE